MSNYNRIAQRDTAIISVLILLVGAGGLAYMFLTPSRLDRQQERWAAAEAARERRRKHLAAERAAAAAFDRHLEKVAPEVARLDPPVPKKIKRRKRKRKSRKRRRRRPVIIRNTPRVPSFPGVPRVVRPPARNVRGTVITMYMTPT
jgi:hypothetical protein